MKTWTSLPLFDRVESDRYAAEGIAVAGDNKANLVTIAREVAVQIAKRKGTVNADDVVREMYLLGYGVRTMGNAMGAVFRDARFVFTGYFSKSERIHAKSNLLRNWKLR